MKISEVLFNSSTKLHFVGSIQLTEAHDNEKSFD